MIRPSTMRLHAKFSDDDLISILIFIVLAAFACMLPAQNDTFLHLRSGMHMWQTGSFLLTEPFSHTAYGAELHNHWWLTQLVFYGVHSLGGPFLLTLFAGACALAAVAGSWRLVRGPWDVRAVLLAWLVITTAPSWSIRPQVVSLLLLMIVLHLVARNRLWWLPLVCVVWGNAHGLVIFGVAMAGAVLLEALLWSRHEIRRAALIVAACVAAPTISPLGWNYWPQILSTVSLARELQIQEYQMPLRPQDLPVLGWSGRLDRLGDPAAPTSLCARACGPDPPAGSTCPGAGRSHNGPQRGVFCASWPRPRYRAYGPLARRWSRPRGDVSGPSVRSGGACA